MTDTLQSIAREIEHSSTCLTHSVDFEQAAQGENCPKCRLEALLAEYEKVDLVKEWREPNVNVRCDENGGSVSYDTSYDATRLQCAAELETWLAANLERIKAEARLEGEISEHKRTCQMYWHVCRGNDARCSEGYTCERLAALEAQAKEKPSSRKRGNSHS